MISLILIFFLLVLIVCIKRNSIYGIMFYYILQMAVPTSAHIFSFSFNLVSLLVLLTFSIPTINKTYKSCDNYSQRYIKVISLVYVGLFALTLGGTIPFTFQWWALIRSYLLDIMPSILLVLYLTKCKYYEQFCKIVCYMALFAALYGIYTYITASNPLFDMFGGSGKDLGEYTNERLGLSGIAVGIYDDKIALSLISFLLLTFIINKDCVSRPILILTCILTFIDMFLTTQRTALFCFLVFLFIMLFDKKDEIVKKYIKISVPLLLIFTFLADNKAIVDFLYSLINIFDDDIQASIGVGGSSTSMRFSQLTNILEYLDKERILIGEGYNYPAYYYKYIFNRELYGLDTRFFGFESFLFKTLVSSGLIGIIIWTIGLVKIFKLLFHYATIYNYAFFISYILAILMTDTSASFYLFFILLVLNSKHDLLHNTKLELCTNK